MRSVPPRGWVSLLVKDLWHEQRRTDPPASVVSLKFYEQMRRLRAATIAGRLGLGPKDRELIATSVRAWEARSIMTEARRAATDCVADQFVPHLRRSSPSRSLIHALTDVAINCRSFGPKQVPFPNVADSNPHFCYANFRDTTLGG